jgi:hypothetical protein
LETRSGTQPKYPEIYGINMENKGHVVYLMATIEHLLCGIDVDVESCIGGGDGGCCWDNER